MTAESDNKNLASKSIVIAAGTLISRACGALRDAVIAGLFSVGLSDLFFIAFTIPNALRVLFGEGATVGAVVPIYQALRERSGDSAARLWLRKLFGLWAFLLTIVSILGCVTAPYWVQLYAPGLVGYPGRFELAVSLTRCVFPFIFFMGLYGITMGVLSAHDRFFLAALAPLLTNLSLIAIPWFFHRQLSVHSLAVAAVIGGALQWVILLIPLAQERLLSWPSLDIRDPNIRVLARRMTPLFFGAGIHQVNIMFSRLFASFLPVGAQSYLYYGQRVVEIPQGLFALAISTATLPTLARHFANHRWDDAEREHTLSQRWTLFLAVPCAIGLMALAFPTASVLFGRGAFETHQVHQTARSLFWQAAAVIPIASIRALIPWFHAQGDTHAVARASVVNLIVFCLLATLLTQGGIARLGHVGIAIAVVAGALIQWALLIRYKARSRDSLVVSARDWLPKLKYGAVLTACSGFAGSLCYFITLGFTWMTPHATWQFEVRRLTIYTAILLLFTILYTVACMTLRIDEVFMVINRLKRTKRGLT